MNASVSRISHLVASLAGLLWCLGAAAATSDAALQAAVANPARSENFVARDIARHPAEELAFFGIKPSMTVVELWPGEGYWTEILGPYLAKQGTYYVALEPSKEYNSKWHARIDAMKSQIGTIHETSLKAAHFDIAPPGSADLVLTFRNLHNWMRGGYAEQALAACFTALKPGGILGIEEHRGRKDKPQDLKAQDGYVREDYMIALAKKAGFVLDGSSDINANPKDTKDWVGGVWTLPPTLSQGDKDRAKYIAVGEADNFVLRFRKPKQLIRQISGPITIGEPSSKRDTRNGAGSTEGVWPLARSAARRPATYRSIQEVDLPHPHSNFRDCTTCRPLNEFIEIGRVTCKSRGALADWNEIVLAALFPHGCYEV